MKGKFFALLGFIGPLIAYTSMGLSIYLSEWFSWERNALSDLGHSQKSTVAPIFNLGLSLAGFTIMLYSVKSLSKYAKNTSASLTFSALMLQLVATFDETYGSLHFLVSILFFVSAGLSCIIYFVEKKSPTALIALIAGLMAWILYWLELYKTGIAVPEIISAIAITSCIIETSLKILCKNN